MSGMTKENMEAFEDYGFDADQLETLDNLILEVLHYGATAYGKKNWLHTTNTLDHCRAALRHLLETIEGTKHDKDTKLHPLTHAMCRVMMAYSLRNK